MKKGVHRKICKTSFFQSILTSSVRLIHSFSPGPRKKQPCSADMPKFAI